MRQIAIAMLFALGVGLASSAVALTPHAANAVAVVPAPWAAGGAAEMVAAVDGRLVATAHGGRIAIARFDDEGFAGKLYGLGALLVLDATIVTACLTLSRAAP